MAEYKALLKWQQPGGADFPRGRYSREHTWTFDGGITVRASASPHVVPSPWSNPEAVDPEEAFVAAIASCHMLTFLYLAGKQGFNVDRYEDEAVGTMAKNENGVSWVSMVTLNPKVLYRDDKIPTAAEAGKLHHLAHDQCFIAQSVKTEIIVQPT